MRLFDSIDLSDPFRNQRPGNGTGAAAAFTWQLQHASCG